MKINPKIDALQLMLTDLRTRNEPIRHKAAFKGCLNAAFVTSWLLFQPVKRVKN